MCKRRVDRIAERGRMQGQPDRDAVRRVMGALTDGLTDTSILISKSENQMPQAVLTISNR